VNAPARFRRLRGMNRSHRVRTDGRVTMKYRVSTNTSTIDEMAESRSLPAPSTPPIRPTSNGVPEPPDDDPDVSPLT
jgi:hypothetical protein